MFANDRESYEKWAKSKKSKLERTEIIIIEATKLVEMIGSGCFDFLVSETRGCL